MARPKECGGLGDGLVGLFFITVRATFQSIEQGLSEACVIPLRVTKRDFSIKICSFTIVHSHTSSSRPDNSRQFSTSSNNRSMPHALSCRVCCLTLALSRVASIRLWVVRHERPLFRLTHHSIWLLPRSLSVSVCWGSVGTICGGGRTLRRCLVPHWLLRCHRHAASSSGHQTYQAVGDNVASRPLSISTCGVRSWSCLHIRL